MINPFYFTDRNLKVRFKKTLESHQINHANSKLIIKPNYLEIGIEVHYNIKNIKKLSVIYARLKNQYKFQHPQYFQQDLINKMRIIKY